MLPVFTWNIGIYKIVCYVCCIYLEKDINYQHTMIVVHFVSTLSSWIPMFVRVPMWTPVWRLGFGLGLAFGWRSEQAVVAGMAIDDDDDFSDYDFSWHLNFKSREETRLEIYVFHHEWVFHSHQAIFKWIYTHKATQIVKNTIETIKTCQCHPLPGHQLL